MLNIVHFEIPADNIQRAKTFYANLFGWKIENMQGMDYMIIDPYSVPGGGIMTRTHPEQQMMVNIEVPLVDEYSAKVEKLGKLLFQRRPFLEKLSPANMPMKCCSKRL